MDEVTKNMVTAQLKSAKTDQALHDSMVSAMIAMVDCQFKTGLRVKRQGLILSGVALILLISLLFGDAEALKLIYFWRTGAAQ